jgi:Tol biopolymer transport system component
MRILPLLAVVTLAGCDGTGEWLRGQAATTAFAAPLASDTTLITTRRVWSSSGPTRNAPFTPSGGTIMPDGAGMASTDWETGDPAIFDLAGREFRRFRINDEPWDTGHADYRVPSPDGSRLAVEWYSYVEGQMQLRIIDVATGESRTIMTADTAISTSIMPGAWTPAGDSVFATIWPRVVQASIPDVQLVLIPAAGGAPRLVHAPLRNWARPWRMSLSTDGRWLLYDHENSREQQIRSDIYVIDVQGGGARPLVEHPAADRLVGWLPGSDVVLFSSDRSGTTDLWSVRVVNGRTNAEPRPVRSGFFQSAAVGFADGALFYTVRTGSSGSAIINVDPHSGALLGPALPPIASLSARLAWSPDGHTIASQNRSRDVNSLTIHSMETGDTRVYWLDEYIVFSVMQWAADGRTLYVRALKTGAGSTGLHHFLRLDPVTGTATRLFAAEEPVALSLLWDFVVTPDGRSLVLRQQRKLDDGRVEITLVLRSLEDGSQRELHRTSGYIPEFSISADGTRLAFMQQVWEDSDSLFVMMIDGSQPLRHVASWDCDEVSLLGWLPAGTALLAARLSNDGMSEEILRVELDGSATMVGISPFRPRRGNRNFQGSHRSRLVFSPAGNRLAHDVDAGQELWRMDGLHELFARDAAGRR